MAGFLTLLAVCLLSGCDIDAMRRDFVAARYLQEARRHLNELPRDTVRAEHELDRALALLPPDHQMHAELGRLYVAARAYAKAARLFQAAPELSRHDRTLLAYCLVQTGHREEGTRLAITVIREADNLLDNGAISRPEWALLLNDAGYLLIDAGVDIEAAHDAVRRAAEAYPLQAPITDSYGWSLLQQGRLNDAAFYLERASRLLGREDPEILYHLGVVYSRLERIRRAEKALRRATELDPNFEPPQKELRRLGRILPPPVLALSPRGRGA